MGVYNLLGRIAAVGYVKYNEPNVNILYGELAMCGILVPFVLWLTIRDFKDFAKRRKGE